MKKLMVLIGAVAILLSACADSPKESDEPPKAEQPGDIALPEGKTFREVIENAKDNEVIDLRNFSGEDSAYKVKAKNVTLKNANLPDATIVVSDAIGDADFTLENCNFHSLLVEGGGSNSVHILGGSIRSLVVSKKGVRVRFEQKVQVETVNVEVDCVLDADAAENTVDSIYINPTVKSVEIGKDGNAAISIGEMKFNVAESGDIAEGAISISKNIQIKSASETIKNKITNSDVQINGTVEDAQVLLIDFISGADISFDVDGGDTVEADASMSNGEAAIKNTSAATDKTLWSSYALMKIPYKGEKGSSYNVKLSLKADKDCSVVVGVRDAMLGVEAGPTYCFTVSTEWKEVEIPTEALFEDWSGYAHLSIGVGDASTVYAKNLKIEKTEDSEFPVSIVYNTKEDIGGVAVSKDGDAAYVIQNKAGAKSGVNLFYGVVEAGKFYKVSFDITADADGQFLDIWGHTFHNAYETSGSGNFEFKKDMPKHIDLYLPCNAVTFKNGSITVKKCVGQIWIGCKDDKAHSIKVSGIKYAESSIEEAIKSGLKQNVAGSVYAAGDTKGAWSVTPTTEPIYLTNGAQFIGQVVLCDEKGWESTEHAVTSFRCISEPAKKLGLQKHSDADNLVYINTSGSDKAITLSIDEATFEVNMSVEDVKEFSLDIKQLPYASVAPSDEESTTEASFSLNDDGGATITNTSVATDKTLWSSFALIKMPYQGKKGSGYNVKLSLKADKDCSVVVGVRDAMLGVEAGPTYCFTVSTEWKEVKIPTGALFEDWSGYAHLSIGVGDASTVYAKNLKIEKTEGSEFPVSIVYNTKEDIGGVTVSKNEDAAYVIQNKAGAKNGVNLFYGVVEAGKFYKVSFDVTADANGAFLNVWGHTFHDDYETSGSGNFVFESGKPKHIDLYLPCYAASLKNGNKKHVGQVWIGCNDENAHSIKVSGIKYAESSIAAAKRAGLDLYVAGEIVGVEGSWTAALNSAPVTVPSGKTFKGQLLLCDAANWGSEEHTVTSFRGISAAAKNLGLKHIPGDEDELYYENTSDSDQEITLSVNEATFEVNMSVN